MMSAMLQFCSTGCADKSFVKCERSGSRIKLLGLSYRGVVNLMADTIALQATKH